MSTEKTPVTPEDEALIAQRRVKAVEVVVGDDVTPEEIAELEEKRDAEIAAAAVKVEAKYNREAAKDPSPEDEQKIAALRGSPTEVNQTPTAEQKAADRAAVDQREKEKKAAEKQVAEAAAKEYERQESAAAAKTADKVAEKPKSESFFGKEKKK